MREYKTREGEIREKDWIVVLLVRLTGRLRTGMPRAVNCSFETPALIGYQYNPTAAGIGWTFSSSSGIQRNGSTWGAAKAPDGVQTAFVQAPARSAKQ